MFKGRSLLIATKHQKELVIAPLIEEALGVNCFVSNDFDTDTLGTFTGEIERELDPVLTVRQKCLKAMEINACDLAIASEGSFGPHPSMFFAKADDEFLIFIDQKNQLEIIVRELSVETNFDGKEVRTESELLEFAKSVQFPSHGIILRKSKDDKNQIIKGIMDESELKIAYQRLIAESDSIYAETDMRAMYNPSRMSVIAKAAEKLVAKIKSCCPQCATPGFGITDARKGLKCSLCSSPTESTLSYIYTCHKCGFEKEDMYPHHKQYEDPMYCSYCNP